MRPKAAIRYKVTPIGKWLNQLLVDLGEPLRNLLVDNDYFSRGGSSFSTQDQYASGWFANPRQMVDVLGHNDIDHAELYLGRRRRCVWPRSWRIDRYGTRPVAR